MSRHSIFNMVLRKQWEGRLNDFLAWALESDREAACDLMREAGIEDIDHVTEVSIREGGEGGNPDLVVRGTANGQSVLLAAEIKLGAFVTLHQADQYRRFRDAVEEDFTAYVLIAPSRRADLRLVADDHFVELEWLLERLKQRDKQVSLGQMAEHAIQWFVDPVITDDALIEAIKTKSISWSIRNLVKTLKGRMAHVAGDQLTLGPLRAGGKNKPHKWYGFTVKRASGYKLAWAGFYLEPTRREGSGPLQRIDSGAFFPPRYQHESGFYVALTEPHLDPADASALGVKDGGADYPRLWSPECTGSDGWTAAAIWQDGLERMTMALVTARQNGDG